MKNIRNFVVLFSVVLGAVALNAQEALHGKFQLNSQVRWGKAVLSAGEYSFVINDMNVPIKMTIHSLNGKTDALEVAGSSAGAAPGGSYIFVTGSGDHKRVCSMNLPQLGRSLIYEPLTKGERETLYASKSHTVPVQLAKK